MQAEIRLHRTNPPGTGNSQMDAIRILGLLPREWTRHLSQADGDMVLRVDTADETTPAQILAAAAAALADPAVAHWRLSACEPLASL
ncbi:hypothetical protein Ssi03_65990 [Sphaerisporangium siamense]|uniref:Uncharacterized protein n=1 Tax=Sphaerisporangium siamense TaxID=795645 RepID=A0A7W7DG71_9ACTN|nr:hypothetical protein [Sphaerisporangium siamense]MBB4706036.1 hypothetical protein [Sphaerisporangium siamense]GII88609.1 hypothetical protein Ssi03_65990 [Sphaerisporangium siamense]